MKNFKLGANFAVFILFFGVATLEALETKHWLRVGFWLAIALVFLVADNLRRRSLGPLS